MSKSLRSNHINLYFKDHRNSDMKEFKRISTYGALKKFGIPDWFKEAKTENIIFEFDNIGNVTCRNGIWKSGEWHGSEMKMCEWFDGIWHGGHFCHGEWYQGKFISGGMTSSTWYNGISYNGYFERVNWEDGVWLNGGAENMHWEDGVWVSGFYNKKKCHGFTSKGKPIYAKK